MIKLVNGVAVEMTAQEAAAWTASLAPTLDEIKQRVTAQVQQRLDSFAATRGYASILSACTYATSSVAKFAAEGQYCVNARDTTWDTCYTILAEVELGQRPAPQSYADIEEELPQLVWPI